jgi:hypothetical protein
MCVRCKPDVVITLPLIYKVEANGGSSMVVKEMHGDPGICIIAARDEQRPTESGRSLAGGQAMYGCMEDS